MKVFHSVEPGKYCSQLSSYLL